VSRGARKEGLSRRHRFSSRGSFGPVLRQSRKLRGEHALLHVITATTGSSRIGVALTRRVAPSAVVRNRVKRAIRELFRRHPIKGAGLDLVVAVREKVGDMPSAAIRAEIQALLDQATDRRGR